MSSWLKQKKQHYLMQAYRPHNRLWKVINEKNNEPISVQLFDIELDALIYSNKTNGILISPKPRK